MSLKRMIFNCLDFNQDDVLSEVDLFKIMRILDGELFVNILGKDVIAMVQMFNNKRISEEEIRKKKSSTKHVDAIKEKSSKRKILDDGTGKIPPMIKWLSEIKDPGIEDDKALKKSKKKGMGSKSKNKSGSKSVGKGLSKSVVISRPGKGIGKTISGSDSSDDDSDEPIILGSDFLTPLAERRGDSVKLTFEDFKTLRFPMGLPAFVYDFYNYIGIDSKFLDDLSAKSQNRLESRYSSSSLSGID